MSKPTLSIIVCSYKGATRIAACLNALRNQEDTANLEIVLVDDGSPDDNVAVAREAMLGSDIPFVVVVHEINAGLGTARNTGITASSAPIIAFTDDDCVPPSNWTRQLRAAWEAADDEIVAVGGHVVSHSTDTLNRRYVNVRKPLAVIERQPVNQTSVWHRLLRYMQPPCPNSTPARPVHSLVGANMSFTRTALDAINGFDPAIRFGGEELDLCRRLAKHFGEDMIIAVPALGMRHEFHPSLHDTMRRARLYGVGDGRDWRNAGGIPPLRPAPVLAIAAVLGGSFFSPILGLVAGLAVPFLLWNHLFRFAASPSIERFTYPVIALVEETMNLYGFVKGAITRGRR